MPNEFTQEVFESEAMQHIDEMFRVAKRMTREQSAAEDLVQETFMQAWKSFDRYEPGTNCRAWLYKIMFNKFEHQRRKKYTEGKYVQEADDLTLLSAAYNEPLPEKLTDRNVIAALNKLPEHYRSVVLLADVQEFDYREVAVILDIPIGTVMSRLSRARGHLRKTLASAAREFGLRVADSVPAAVC